MSSTEANSAVLRSIGRRFGVALIVIALITTLPIWRLVAWPILDRRQRRPASPALRPVFAHAPDRGDGRLDARLGDLATWVVPPIMCEIALQ